MNKERILALAKDFEKGTLPEFEGKCPHFDMADWFYVPGTCVEPNICGTTMCLAGAAVLKFQSEVITLENWEVVDYFERAQVLLDLTAPEAVQLFTPGNIYSHTRDTSYAAKVLRHLAETGEVNWHLEGEKA